MKRLVTSLTILGLLLTMSMPVYAGQWLQDNIGWWYQNEEKSYFTNGWHWIDGECYYFTPEGYCLVDTTTPDGYQVDANGAWILDGVVQSKNIDNCGDNTQLNKQDINNLVSFANEVYDSTNSPYHSDVFDTNINVGDLDAEEKASILYWYQFYFENTDDRLSEVDSEDCADYEIFNSARPDDLKDIMKEILGSCTNNDISTFKKTYVDKKSNGLYYMNNCGSFGDAGAYYLSSEKVAYNMENEILKVTGDVVQYQSSGNGYCPVKTYTAFFIPYDNSHISGYQFKQLIVQ